MKLYLVRHGEANPPEVDPEKGLSDEGKADVAKIAEFLKKAGVGVGEIYHSEKARAVQTAEIFKKALGVERIVQKTGLTPNDEITALETEIRHREEGLMVVGHLPYLDRLASSLLTGDESLEVIEFPASSVLFLEFKELKWELKWMVGPELLS